MKFKRLAVLSMALTMSFAYADKKVEVKEYTPSDYRTNPVETWDYFYAHLPKVLATKLTEEGASFITACKGNYVDKTADEHVIGFINGKKNMGVAMVYSINKKTSAISSKVVKEFPSIASEIVESVVPVVEVYCEKDFIQAKTNQDGLPAYRYDQKTKTFQASEKDLQYPE